MADLISQNFIANLLARIDIVEIISARLQLKKAGANYSALCPFHNEKTPSFSVSSTKQFYYCFGCGAHGNAITFLMAFDRLDFVTTIETLAALTGIEVPRETVNSNNNQDLYGLLEQVNKYYQRQLRNSETAINYLKSREVSGAVCKKYNIGYAPPGWENLLANFGTAQQQHEQMIAAGMLINNESRIYDRFRNRIMFPIRDARGRVVGFGGRALHDDTPKYLNSPETVIFHKGNELYGIFEARQKTTSLPYLIVVEGYMDVISLVQHGIDYAVATLGTGVTTAHIQKLLRYCEKLIFCFDGDAAGKNAAWRALENLLPIMRDGINVLFLFLPTNEDPDTQIRKEGKELFLQRFDQALTLSDFLFKHLTADINLSTMAGRATLAKEATLLLKKLPNGVFQRLMLDKLANLVKIDAETLYTLQFRDEKRNQHDQSKSTNGEVPKLISSAISLLLHKPQLAEHISDPSLITLIDLPYATLLADILILLKEHKNAAAGTILERYRNQQESKILARLMANEVTISLQDLKNEFIDTIQRLYDLGRQQTIQKLLSKVRQGNISDNERLNLQKLITDAKIKVVDGKKDSK